VRLRRALVFGAVQRAIGITNKKKNNNNTNARTGN